MIRVRRAAVARLQRVGVLAAFALLLVGCYNPNYRNGAVNCGTDTPACPDGYHCAQDNTCWQDGHDPNTDAGVTGTDPNGTQCSAGNTCASGFCVDGVCCNRSCDGQCEACDVSTSPGTCSAVGGPPHGSRTSCTGFGTTCGGTCDGVNTATCSYPPSSTICGAACDGQCNGSGSCSSSTGGTCPNGYACGTNACKTSCSGPTDCQTNFTCSGSACVRIAESDCLDGLDNNGDGLIDCADPTCTQVECVPSASTPVGTVQTGCDPGVTGTHINQGFSSPTTCHGCGCTASGTCTVSISGDNTGNGCVNPNALLGTFSASTTCINITSAPYYSLLASASASATCTTQQTGVPDAAGYSISKNFCPSPKSSAAAACSGGHVCVAKPVTGSVCTLVGGATCPSSYPTANNTWYGDGTTTDNRSCTCGACSVSSNGSCGNGLSYFAHTSSNTAAKCVDNPAPYNYCGGGCCGWNLGGTTTDYYWNHNVSIDSLQLHSLPANSGATCSAGSGTVTSGTATAGTKYTECCL